MKIIPTLLPLLDTTQRELPSLLKHLQLGQVLPAKVLAELQPGLLRLQIATTELLARSEARLAAGTELRLQVVKAQPMPELRILHEPGTQGLREQIVRSAMSRQLPAREVRESLAELRPQAQSARQTEALRQVATILQDAGVRPHQLNPAHLQRAIALSGLFHEARFATGMPAEPADTKTRLLQLLAMLTTGPDRAGPRPPGAPPGTEPATQSRETAGDSLLGRLLRLIEGSVARIQLQQSAALPTDDSQRQAWQIGLPIHLPDETDEVMLRIEREAPRGDAEGRPEWAVNLAFQFDTIGTLQCRIALSGERVATTFWCEDPTTQARLERRLPVLRDALTAQGLEVVHLAGIVGEPAEPLIRIERPESLLDERA